MANGVIDLISQAGDRHLHADQLSLVEKISIKNRYREEYLHESYTSTVGDRLNNAGYGRRKNVALSK